MQVIMKNNTLMEVISEQNENITSEQFLKQSGASCDLLIRAHTRIRQLEEENQQLKEVLALRDQQLCQSALAVRQVKSLSAAIQEKDIRIQNLERINEQTLLQVSRLEKYIQKIKAKPHLQKLSVPKQLNSPLLIDKNNQSISRVEFPLKFQRPITPQRHIYTNPVSIQASPYDAYGFSPKGQKQPQFTFLPTNEQKSHSPHQSRQPRTLKNCFSQIQINKIINETNHNNKLARAKSRQQLASYHNYCSNIQKKHSPNTINKHVVTFAKKQIQGQSKSPSSTLLKIVRPLTGGQLKWTQSRSGYSTGFSGGYSTGYSTGHQKLSPRSRWC